MSVTSVTIRLDMGLIYIIASPSDGARLPMPDGWYVNWHLYRADGYDIELLDVGDVEKKKRTLTLWYPKEKRSGDASDEISLDNPWLCLMTGDDNGENFQLEWWKLSDTSIVLPKENIFKRWWRGTSQRMKLYSVRLEKVDDSRQNWKNPIVTRYKDEERIAWNSKKKRRKKHKKSNKEN